MIFLMQRLIEYTESYFHEVSLLLWITLAKKNTEDLPRVTNGHAAFIVSLHIVFHKQLDIMSKKALIRS
jgi:hypothetical protein